MSTESDLQLHRDVGRIEGDVKALEQKVSDLQTKMDDVHKVVMQAQGGWKMMVIVGTIGAAIGSGLAWLIQFLTGRGT